MKCVKYINRSENCVTIQQKKECNFTFLQFPTTIFFSYSS
jgi:hypothetical protein